MNKKTSSIVIAFIALILLITFLIVVNSKSVNAGPNNWWERQCISNCGRALVFCIQNCNGVLECNACLDYYDGCVDRCYNGWPINDR